jgi:hypothetical protein
VVTLLEELTGTHPRWVSERPEVRYFMARSMWAEAAFGDAVRVMRQYVERLLIDEAAARDEAERLANPPAEGATPATTPPTTGTAPAPSSTRQPGPAVAWAARSRA